MERGINKFNVNPKDGIAYLIENGLITDTADSICNFLCTGEGLSKRRIGEYFGRVRIRDNNGRWADPNEGSRYFSFHVCVWTCGTKVHFSCGAGKSSQR